MASAAQSQDQPVPSVVTAPESISIIAAGIGLAVIGWSGLIALLVNSLPTIPNRWLFFAFLQLALMGTAMPFVSYLNRRFGPGRADEPGAVVLLRQAAWVGLAGTLCAWLRIPRLLSIPLVLIIIAAMVAIEFLLRLRERTQWRPE